jgi:hypothetical protein
MPLEIGTYASVNSRFGKPEKFLIVPSWTVLRVKSGIICLPRHDDRKLDLQPAESFKASPAFT